MPIRDHVMKIISSMNQYENDVFHDRRFVFILMMELFEIADMVQFKLDEEKTNVLKGNFICN